MVFSSSNLDFCCLYFQKNPCHFWLYLHSIDKHKYNYTQTVRGIEIRKRKKKLLEPGMFTFVCWRVKSVGCFVILVLPSLSYLFVWGVWQPTTLLFADRHKVKQHSKGEKYWEIRKKKKRKGSQPWPTSQLLPSQDREREITRKEKGWREKDWDFVLVWLLHFIYLFIFIWWKYIYFV